MKQYHVYIMSNLARTISTGVTSNLHQRVYQHQRKLIPGFTSKYNLTRLVYFEETTDVHAAIAMEKQVKTWTRAKRVALIESLNPAWSDLSMGWYDGEPRAEAHTSHG